MGIPNKSFQPTLALTIKATMDLPAYRFVDYQGKLCDENQKSLGVSVGKWSNGSFASVIVLGTAIVEAGTTINAGDKIASDSTGRAKVATTGSEINGRALNSANTGEYVRVLLIQ